MLRMLFRSILNKMRSAVVKFNNIEMHKDRLNLLILEIKEKHLTTGIEIVSVDTMQLSQREGFEYAIILIYKVV